MLEHPREAIQVAAILLGAVSVTLIGIGLLTKRAARTACRKCGYDLASHSPLTCPECGCDPRMWAPPRRQTRWGVIATALLPLLACATLLVLRRPIAEWWWDRLSPWVEREVRAGGPIQYRWSIGRGDIDESPDEWLTNCRLEARRPGDKSTLIATDERRADVGDPAAVDLTGDGVPEQFVRTHSGGAHCCHRLYVLDPTEPNLLIGELDGAHSDLEVRDLDRDGVAEVMLADWTFAYWNAPFSGSPCVEVVVAWRGGRFTPAVELMHRPRVDDAELAEEAEECRRSMTQPGAGHQRLNPQMWGRMLELLYSGTGTRRGASSS